MCDIIKKREYLVTWIVLIVGTLGAALTVSLVVGLIDTFFDSCGIRVDNPIGTVAGFLIVIASPLLPFFVFVVIMEYTIVRKVKERVRQEVHQRYQKLLEEKDIQLEDSNV